MILLNVLGIIIPSMNSEFLQSSFEKGQYKGTTLAFEHYSTDFEKYLVDEKWLTFDDVWHIFLVVFVAFF